MLDDFVLRESRAGGSCEEVCVSRAEGAHLGDGVFFSVPGSFNCGVNEGVSEIGRMPVAYRGIDERVDVY